MDIQKHLQLDLLDNLPIGICVVDSKYNIVFWNDCLESWTNFSRVDVLDKKLGHLFPHFNETRYTRRIDPILAGGPPTIFSSQLHAHLFPSRLPNGKQRIFETIVSTVPSKIDYQYYALFAVKNFTELSYRIMDHHQIEKKILKEIEQRKSVETELRRANAKILAQQKTVIEEERLKVLLQMAGATAHELNQPLMVLLGNIELLEMGSDDIEESKKYIANINEAGKKISAIVSKIQRVKNVTSRPYAGDEMIIDIHQEKTILHIEDDPAAAKLIQGFLKNTQYRHITLADSFKSAKELLKKEDFDIILLDYILNDGDAFQVLDFIRENHIHTPVIIATGKGDESLVSKLIRNGATDYLPKLKLNKETLIDSIEFVLSKFYLIQGQEKTSFLTEKNTPAKKPDNPSN